MFANKRLTVQEALQCIITTEKPHRRVNQHLIANAKYSFIKANISRLLKGEGIVSYTDPAIAEHWSDEAMRLRILLQKPLIVFLATFDADAETDKLVKRIIKNLLGPCLRPIPEVSLMDCLFTISGETHNLFEQAYASLYLSLYSQFFDKISNLETKLRTENPEVRTSPFSSHNLDDLLEKLDEMQRLQELLNLPERADEKRADHPKEIIRPPQLLKLVKTYSKVKRTKGFSFF